MLQVKMNGPEGIASIEAAWEKVNPGKKINYRYIGVEIKEFYELFFGWMVKIIGFISFLAIAISCLGFGKFAFDNVVGVLIAGLITCALLFLSVLLIVVRLML